jgi:outer membrane protease
MDLSQAEPMEKRGFFLNLSLKFGIPGASGYMENRDWLSTVNTGLTHYSKHDNNTRELFFLDISSGLSFPLKQAFLLKTFINFSFMRFSFYGMDGYGIYALDNGNGIYESIDDPSASRHQFKGKVVSYTQEWLYAAPGVSIGYCYNNYFSAEISFQISPLVLCAGLDEHKTTNVQYRDYMLGGIFLEPGVRLSVAVSKWLEASWDFSWRYISGTRGYTHRKSPIGSGIDIKDGEAGAGLSIITSGILLKILF